MSDRVLVFNLLLVSTSLFLSCFALFMVPHLVERTRQNQQDCQEKTNEIHRIIEVEREAVEARLKNLDIQIENMRKEEQRRNIS